MVYSQFLGLKNWAWLSPTVKYEIDIVHSLLVNSLWEYKDYELGTDTNGPFILEFNAIYNQIKPNLNQDDQIVSKILISWYIISL